MILHWYYTHILCGCQIASPEGDVELVLEIVVEADERNLVHTNYTLIRAEVVKHPTLNRSANSSESNSSAFPA